MTIKTINNPTMLLPLRSLSASSGGSSKTHAMLLEEVEKTAYRLFYNRIEEKDKWKLSALYMQATEGACTEPKPKSSDLEIAYWTNWKKLGDMSREEAGQRYLEIAAKYM